MAIEQMKFKIYMRVLLWRFRMRSLLDADLRHLLDKKQLIIKITVEDNSRYLAFDDGKIMLLKRFSATPTLALTFKGAQIMASTINSAAVGDNFWLTALRDRRVHLVGDMGILIWFFGLCRHLPWRRAISEMAKK